MALDRIFAGAAVSTLVGVAAALATPNRSAEWQWNGRDRNSAERAGQR